jgi:hypothetical protein
MQTFKIQWATATNPNEWYDLLEHPTYESLRAAEMAVEDLEFDADGREHYRAVEVD